MEDEYSYNIRQLLLDPELANKEQFRVLRLYEMQGDILHYKLLLHVDIKLLLDVSKSLDIKHTAGPSRCNNGRRTLRNDQNLV